MGNLLSCFRRPVPGTPAVGAATTPESHIAELSDAKKPDPKDFYIHHRKGETIVRAPGSIKGYDFVIEDCEDCHFYLCDSMSQITIDACKNCTFFIGPVGGSFFLRESSQCKVVAAVGQFRTRDVEHTDFLLFSRTQPVIEESRHLRFGCFAHAYAGLRDQFTSAGLSLFSNEWSDVYDFTAAPGNWSMMPVETVAQEFLSYPPTPDAPVEPSTTSTTYTMPSDFQFQFQGNELVVPKTLGNQLNKPYDEDCFVLLFPEHATANDSFIHRVHESPHRFITTKERHLALDQAIQIFGREDSMPPAARPRMGKGEVIGIQLNGLGCVAWTTDALIELQKEHEEVRGLIYSSKNPETARKEIDLFFETVTVNVDMDDMI